MPSYQKRGTNSFLLTVEAGYNAKGKRVRRTKTIRVDPSLLKTKRKLDNHLNQELVKFEMEVQAGEYIAPEKKTVTSFKKDWMEKHAVKNLALRTRQNYEEKLNNYILPYLGHMKISEVKPIHIINFMDEVSKPEAAKKKKEGLSDSTLYEIDKTLRVLFNKAAEWRVISKSPLEGLRRPKIRRKEMKFLEGDEVRKLFKALQNEPSHWRLYF
ncbi:site-specific integrase [Halobacillus trueperi]|uniref:Site-specific integrase n=1 Tax=Halobacillus trueperi TaxID=156205 RepID=A0A3D8VII2_9BACI|nr:N-terminal phage integrase SAM-like domain-containing protein [Halobacillus trueperi]RDY69133.1 site-specific integrase [Halobacillus trueperi]